MQTLGSLIDRNEKNYPELVAFATEERSVTYRQYAQRCRRLAGALYDLGLRRQDRVVILSTNNLEFLEASGACEWSGLIAAMFNFRMAEPEVEWLLRDSAPKVIFFEAQFAGLIKDLRGQFPDILCYVCIGEGCPTWAIPFEELLGRGSEVGPPVCSRPDDYVFLFFTSGTTGKPKGVPYTHRAALWNTMIVGRARGPDVCILQITPLFHTGGRFFPLASMWLGGKTVLLKSFEPLNFLEIVQRHRITFAFMVAPMIQAVLDHPHFSRFNLSSLREVMSASAAISVPLLKRAIKSFGPIFFIAYGSTETGTVCTLNQHELKPEGSPENLKRLASVGHFEPEIEALILDERGEPCAPLEIGEICVQSPVFSGYWNNTVANLESLSNGYFRTGDMAYCDDEGYVFLVDRKKDMIISGGENIYSREVEDALYLHPSILEVAVIGIPDQKWGEVVKAIVALRPDVDVTAEVLIAFCGTQIARYKCPNSINFVAHLPRLGTGKIDKVALRKQYLPPI